MCVPKLCLFQRRFLSIALNINVTFQYYHCYHLAVRGSLKFLMIKNLQQFLKTSLKTPFIRKKNCEIFCSKFHISVYTSLKFTASRLLELLQSNIANLCSPFLKVAQYEISIEFALQLFFTLKICILSKSVLLRFLWHFYQKIKNCKIKRKIWVRDYLVQRNVLGFHQRLPVSKRLFNINLYLQVTRTKH